MHVACVLIDHLPFKLEMKRDPGLRNRKAIIVQRQGSRRIVLDASPSARTVLPGMSLQRPVQIIMFRSTCGATSCNSRISRPKSMVVTIYDGSDPFRSSLVKYSHAASNIRVMIKQFREGIWDPCGTLADVFVGERESQSVDVDRTHNCIYHWHIEFSLP